MTLIKKVVLAFASDVYKFLGWNILTNMLVAFEGCQGRPCFEQCSDVLATDIVNADSQKFTCESCTNLGLVQVAGVINGTHCAGQFTLSFTFCLKWRGSRNNAKIQ